MKLKVRHEDIRLLMNRLQLSYIFLKEVVLKNVKYNLGREYNFYATVLPGQRSKGGTAVAIRIEIPHKRLNIRTTLQAVALDVYLVGKRKIIICSIYLHQQNK